jgi:hypothetical protein
VIRYEESRTGFSAKARSEIYRRGMISLALREGYVWFEDKCVESVDGRRKGTGFWKCMKVASSICGFVVAALGLEV